MSSTSTPGTFQVTTEQIFVSNSRQTQDARTQDSRVIEVGADQLRIDSLAENNAPHFRARQLNEFTAWLQQTPQQSSGSALTDARLSETPSNSLVPGIKTQNILRVDPPIVDRQNANLSAPHFDTTNYIAPDLDNRTGQAGTIPTDGFDPSSGVLDTIQKLKSDGRIIGDLHQSANPEDLNIVVPGFKWPQVSTSLLGSPAVLNLEMNVENFMTSHCNQILVASTRRGAGATTVALSLARQLVAHGKKVLLIDADLSNPMLATRLGLTHRLSWIQSISDRRLPNEVIIKQKSSELSLMPLTPVATRVGWPRKMYDEFSKISNPIAWNYDVVVVDVGPASQFISESSTPTIQAATTLLVSGKNESADSDLQRAKAGLLSFGIDNMLIVENFSQIKSAAHAKVG